LIPSLHYVLCFQRFVQKTPKTICFCFLDSQFTNNLIAIQDKLTALSLYFTLWICICSQYVMHFFWIRFLWCWPIFNLIPLLIIVIWYSKLWYPYTFEYKNKIFESSIIILVVFWCYNLKSCQFIWSSLTKGRWWHANKSL
jgi:hypothetical protein